MILYNKFHCATLVYTHLIVQDDCNFIISASEDFLFLKIITHIILFLGHINTFCIKKAIHTLKKCHFSSLLCIVGLATI